MHGVEDEMKGDAQAVMLHYDVYLGVILIASICQACSTTCTVLLLFCSMVFQAKRRVHVHTWRTAARDLCEIVIIQQ